MSKAVKSAAAASLKAETAQQEEQQQAQPQSAEEAPKRRQRIEVAAAAATGDAAQFEAEHVHGVYSTIAQKFSETRFKPWPRVLDFVQRTPDGSVIIDVGCGNGKNMGKIPKSRGILEIGCDRSIELLSIASQRKLPVVACDMMALPFRPGCADAVICIAVLHHLATAQRRLEALRQMFRLLRPGSGRLLIYVWSTHFAQSEIAKGRADPSVLGASVQRAKQQQQQQQQPENDDSEQQQQRGDDDADDDSNEKHPPTGVDVFVSFETKSTPSAEPPPCRFYHLFGPGEAEALCRQIGPEAEIADTWFDHENWAVEVKHRGSA